jgi:hypothetical protein
MPGLLDILNTYEGQQALGLLAAAGPRADGAGVGQRLQEGLGSADSWQSKKNQQEMMRLQMDQHRMALEAAKRQLADQESERMTAMKYLVPASVGQGAIGGIDKLLPPNLQAGLNSGPIPAKPASFDMRGFAQERMSQNPIAGMALMQALQKETPISKVDVDKFTPSSVARFQQSSNYADLIPRNKLEFVEGVGVDPYDPKNTGRAIANPNKPFSMGPNGEPIPNLPYQRYELNRSAAGAAKTSISMSDGQKGFENEMKLAGAFKQEPIYKDHSAVQAAFSQINASLAQGTPISDTAAATKIMKILDPGSVVRESELGMAMAAGGRMDRLKNYMDQAVTGTKLTPQQRTDFGNLASELTAASAHTYNSKRGEYLQQGNDYGLLQS